MDRKWLDQLARGIEPEEPKVLEVNFSGVNMKIPKDTHLVVTTVEVNPGTADPTRND